MVIVWLLYGYCLVRVWSFVCLVIQQGVDLVGGEDFVGNLLELGRGDLAHLGECLTPCWRMVVIEHLLGHRQGIVLLILRRNSHLTLQLAQSALQLGTGQSCVAQLLEFLVAELQACVFVLWLTREVNIPVARIAQRHCLRVDIVHQSMLLAQTEVQAAGHTATAQDIVQEIHGQLLRVTYRVGMRTQHDMRLMGVAFV